ncbi:MAG: L-threonine 3-dehydrogenase [Acidimicrobiia bacterium]
MRAVVKIGPGPGLEMVDRPTPVPAAGEVLVRVKATSICGTDLHIRAWDSWAAEHVLPPLVVGHEICGIVEAHGPGVSAPAIGTLVSLESHVVDGDCAWCRTGRGHLCPQTRILGVHRDGAFAEYVTIPAVNAWPNPPGTPYSIATLLENFGNAVHAASTPPVAGRKVLVTGAGPVGIMAVAVARALGARSVISTDVSDYRLALAAKMGATLTLNPRRDDIVAGILTATDGEGVDVLLEMSGAESAILEGFEVLKPGGHAALLGLSSKPFQFDLDDAIVFKGATVHGIVGRRLWDTWYEGNALLRSGGVDLTPLVTHRFRLEDFDAAFDLMASGECGKVVMFVDPADADGPLETP